MVILCYIGLTVVMGMGLSKPNIDYLHQEYAATTAYMSSSEKAKRGSYNIFTNFIKKLSNVHTELLCV